MLGTLMLLELKIVKHEDIHTQGKKSIIPRETAQEKDSEGEKD